MNLETLNQQIVATIDASENEALLQDVLEILTQRSSIAEDKDSKTPQLFFLNCNYNILLKQIIMSETTIKPTPLQ